jgi:hypothetical protein
MVPRNAFGIGVMVAVGTTVMTADVGADIIDFDSLSAGDVVTNQFPQATFSSIAGQENRVDNTFDFGPLSAPNYICTADVGGGLNCVNPTIVDFTNPVNNLTFLALGDNSVGTQATVDVFENGTYSATVPVVVDGDFATIHTVDLSGFSNVTRIEIENITDGGGLAWDRFEFDVVAQEGLIYFEEDGGGGNPRGLYDFDPSNGMSSLRTTVGAGPRFFSLSKRPSDGTVFGSSPGASTSELYTVDVDTGAFNLECPSISDTIADITFDPNSGTLYGLGRNTSDLYVIDLAACTSSLVGNAAPVRAGIAFDPSGTMYGFEVFGGDFYEIDHTDASVTFIGNSGDPVSLIEDADFTSSGDLYITDFNGMIYAVDPVTGDRTIVKITGMSAGLLGILGGVQADTCPWDLDGSGSVGTSDLLDLLSQWGTNPGGPPDFDGDGNVGGIAADHDDGVTVH